MSIMKHPTTSLPDNKIAAERFEAYRAASMRAQHTMDLCDGIAAGHAWAAFLEAFVPGDPSSKQSATGTERRR